MCVCVCVCVHTYTHTHIPDSVETVYGLPMLPNNTASETILRNSEAVRNVDWVFIIRLSAWWWLGVYVTLDKTAYILLF